MDFISVVQKYLEEKDEKLDVLFSENIISKNTFYKYKQRNPSLVTLINISNYLEADIDYLYGRVDVNYFIRYSKNQNKFYDKLIKLIKSKNISNRQFCKDLSYSKDNLIRYKNGVMPSVRTLFEIVDYFDCSVNELLTREYKKS